jgi:hypothetical protein
LGSLSNGAEPIQTIRFSVISLHKIYYRTLTNSHPRLIELTELT